MDSLEVNKTIAAVLVAGIAFMVTGFIGEILVHPRELEHPAIKIAGAPAEATAAAQQGPPRAPPIVPLLAAADPAEGQKLVETNCAICHTFNQGGGPKIGPNLYGIVGAPRAHASGFDYTAGVKKLGGTWTYENLNEWLWDPRAVVPDTRMAFAGLKNNKQRADVIAYLRSLSASPQPLPSPEEVKAAEAAAQASAAPAAGEKPTAPAAAPQANFPELLAAADPEKGKKVAQTQCAICHSFGKGEKPKIGPNLYGIIGAARAHEAGFDYSAGLKKLGGRWTYDELDQWLSDPKAVVPDTRMIFPGIKSEKERADVVAYLRSLADQPEPLPKPAVAPAAATPPAAPPTQAAEQPAAPTPVPQPAAPQPAAPQPAAFTALVAAADPAEGKKIAETQCAICHSFGKGEKPKIGPNLYGIIGAARAHEAGFDYSAGLKKLGGSWTYDELNQWLSDPKAVVPDTRMIFPGIKSEKERAAVAAYLRTLADQPEPLAKPATGSEQAPPAAPPPAASEAGGPAAPASPPAPQKP
jgi:cytochrome c